MTVTPGIAAAVCHKSVSGQSAAKSVGAPNRTVAETRAWARAMRIASSPMLARVHGQWGWANISNVGFPGARGICVSVGHRSGAEAPIPGVFSYRLSSYVPTPTPIAHAIPATNAQLGKR